MNERVPVAFEEYYAPLDLWTEVTAYPEEEGGIIVFFRDVTEKKRLEAALKRSEERYELASRATQEAIWDWDLVTDSIAWNEGVRTLFGYAPEEEGPSGAWWLEHIHPEDRERVDRDIHAFIASASAERWVCEYRFLRADGSHAEIVDRGYVARDEQGRALREVRGLAGVRREAGRQRHLLLGVPARPAGAHDPGGAGGPSPLAWLWRPSSRTSAHAGLARRAPGGT
ncbi:PAS domain-containing protein [Cystobacter fuscus]